MKVYEAKKNNKPFVDVGGSGTPVREWLYVDDGAEAMIKALDIDSYDGPINIGIGKGISILELAEKIKEAFQYDGQIKLDTTKPDGAPYKTVDGTLGKKLMKWSPQMNFNDGINDTVKWYITYREGSK